MANASFSIQSKAVATARSWSPAPLPSVALAVGLLTWNAMATLFTTAGSMLTTYAMFYIRGAVLRIAMVGVAALWMNNAWAYDSWWQMFGKGLNGGAAAYGAWRAAKADASAD